MPLAGRLWAMLALLVANGALASETGVGLYLWELGEQPLADTSLDDGPVLGELEFADPEAAASRLTEHATTSGTAVNDGSITHLVGASERVRAEPAASDLEATFVIDFDEPPVASLAAPNDSSVEDLRQLVFEHISEKTYARGYDIASRVARTGSGDCTEHAVLLAALARANGFPARVVFGMLLVEADEVIRAYGHAWTEIHTEGRWQVLDATLPAAPETEGWTRYVPIMPLVNEGPGYMMGLIELATVWPIGVRIAIPPAGMLAE